jgi:ubiquitin-conjugating enzyme E2 variant
MAHREQHPSTAVRALDWTSLLSYAALACWLAVELVPGTLERPWLVLTAVLLGYLAADLVSGLVHWAADTWGSPDLPVIGPALIGPFREHHRDQLAITRHDFVETNGNNCLISLPVLGIALWLAPGPHGGGSLFLSSFLLALVFWVLLTNQFHKWAHLPRPPPLLAFLQRWHLILPPAHHQLHHTRPFTSHYCITTGWLNWPLNWMRFFPVLEWCITACTGALPRRDDLGTLAAEKVMAENLPLPPPAPAEHRVRQ